MLQSFQEYSKVPIFLHLDHSDNEKAISFAIECGFDSIMIDGSTKAFHDNLQWTKQWTQIAHTEGIMVEAELGKLAGEEVIIIIIIIIILALTSESVVSSYFL
jgi:fructose-bisphosphate aldolase, class II